MHFSLSSCRVVRVVPCLLVLLADVICGSACSAHYQLVPRATTADSGGPSWFGPARQAEQARLARWASAVGPPFIEQRDRAPRASDEVTLVTWNTAVGEGDVAALLADLRHGEPDDPAHPIILLLQEAYRESSNVPMHLQSTAAFAGHLGATPTHGGDDIETIASKSGLNVYYVPSMRNGGPAVSDEDRGNAILSNLPLHELGAIELPFERQRRVAVAATAEGRSSRGRPWRMRLVSAHLDNMVGPNRLWFAGGGFARARQARALVDHVREDDVAAIGGDFNTWFGFAESAFQETARAFTQSDATDPRPTFHNLLRLDHLFMRLPAGWHAEVARGRSRYGSDHWPLIATIRTD